MFGDSVGLIVRPSHMTTAKNLLGGKEMKKSIALLLALAMVFALCACSSTNSTTSTAPEGESSQSVSNAIPLDGSWPEEHIKIGVVAFDTTDDSFVGVMDYFNYLTDYFNVEFIVSESLDSAEGEATFIDNCAAAGCQGIFAYYNVAGAEAIKRATSQGMYYWGIEQFYEEVADDPYYVGTYTFSDDSGNNGDYQAGYELGYTMATSGLSHIAFGNGGADFGVQMFVDRQQGFFDGVAAAQAEGSTTQFDPSTDVVSGFPDNDAFFVAQSTVLAGDYDGVGTAFDAMVWFQPIIDSGKDIKVGTIGTVNDTYKSFVDSGTVIALVYDCGEVVFGSGFADLINAITGHTELTRGADGRALLNPTQRWTLSSADDFNAVYEKHITDGEFYITAEDMATILGGINPDATYEDVNALFDVSLDDVR